MNINGIYYLKLINPKKDLKRRTKKQILFVKRLKNEIEIMRLWNEASKK